MATNSHILPADPFSPPARAMGEALWEEIQHRYGFVAPYPFDPAAYSDPIGSFWLATEGGQPVGSIALSQLDDRSAELDVMYVVPSHRRTGVAQALLAALEDHARAVDVSVLRLRAGLPQPEALRFYAAAGFAPIPPYGRWIGDDTAQCWEKILR